VFFVEKCADVAEIYYSLLQSFSFQMMPPVDSYFCEPIKLMKHILSEMKKLIGVSSV